MNNNRNVSTFSPFITFCQHVIPLAYDESMSYYETLCALRDYLVNTVIPAVNNNADAVTELQNKYNEFTENINNIVNELENYIDNYFNNLDVQDEINNKLDKMAESGELTDIIAQYLQLASVLAFNTRNDLKNASNLNNGSFTYCFGKNTYNDGYPAFYKIRKLINTDEIDGEDLIALTNYPELVAEKMPDNYLKDINDNLTGQINTINNTTIPNIKNDINELDDKIENFEKQKITIVLGDSWTSTEEDSVDARDNGKSWVEYYEPLTKNLIKQKAEGGSGIARPGNIHGQTFAKQLENILNEITDKSLIDTIIIYGGLNDIDSKYNSVQIKEGMDNINNLISSNNLKCKTYFMFFNQPKRNLKNTEIELMNDIVGYATYIGWIGIKANGFNFGTGLNWASNNYHQNNRGSKQIAYCIYNILNGNLNYYVPITSSLVQFQNAVVTTPTNVNCQINSQIVYDAIQNKLQGRIIRH